MSSHGSRQLAEFGSRLEQDEKIPLELWRVVFSYLSVKELCRASCVCRSWRWLVSSLDGTTWKQHFLSNTDWGDPQWPCHHSNAYQKPWQHLYREHYQTSHLWAQAAVTPGDSGCFYKLKKRKQRKVICVGRAHEHKTLKSALCVASDYDKILISPGLYDEQFEMSSKIPFELVGNGPPGSVTLIMSIEQNAPTGRLCNLVLRAPWFTSHVLKVPCGHLAVESCQLEDGQVLVQSPGTAHFRYCSFVRLQMSLQHLPTSVVENCEFVNCESTCLTIEGDVKEQVTWAHPHLESLCDGWHDHSLHMPVFESSCSLLTSCFEEEDSIGVASIAASQTTFNTSRSSCVMSSSACTSSSCDSDELPTRVLASSNRKVNQEEVENLDLNALDSDSISSAASSQSSEVSVLQIPGSGRLSPLWSSDSESVVEAALQTSFIDTLHADPVLREEIMEVQGPVIRFCRFSKSHGGITVCRQGQCRIYKCQLKDLQYGIRCLQNAKVAIIENDIHHCTTSGIFMRLAAHGVIAGNDIYYTSEAGIDVRKNADPLIQCNRIHHSKRSGIVVLGSGCGTLKGNDIYQNREAGIYILYRGNPYVSGNRICHGGASGIAVNENGRGYIVDNFISGNRWGGIDIRHGSQPTVTRNLICNGMADGIVIGNRGRGTIEANTIKGNEGCGVWVMGGQPLIQMNQIYNNHNTGVSFVNNKEGEDTYSADDDDVASITSNSDVDFLDPDRNELETQTYLPQTPELKFNTIFHNNGCGVLADCNEIFSLMGNAVHANRDIGVHVKQSEFVTVINNSITCNANTGLHVAANSVIKGEGNGIYDNNGHGVVIEGKATLTHNDIFCNQISAVFLDGKAQAQIENNRLHAPQDVAVSYNSTVKATIAKNQLYQGEKDVLPDVLPDSTTTVLDNEIVQNNNDWKCKSGRDWHLEDPPPRPHIDAPAPVVPKTPVRRVTTVTRVVVPSGGSCQNGSKLCAIL